MKKFYFLCSLPRAGNTLFASLMNQNKNVLVSPYSVVPNLIKPILDIKNHRNFLSFPDHSLVDNVLNNLLDNCYTSWNANRIIDRGPWGHPDCLPYLKNIVPDAKFIILYRPILEVLASVVALDKPEDPVSYCDHLMTGSFVSDGYQSIRNLVQQKEKYIVVQYNDLIKDPVNTVKTVCNFLDIGYETLKLKSLDQYSVNGISYDDTFFKGPYHDIRTDSIKKNKRDIDEWLPSEVVKRYSAWDLSFD